MLRAFMYDRQHDIILLMQEDQNTKCKKTMPKYKHTLVQTQLTSGNIRFTVGQYWLIIKINGLNSVNFVGNSVNFVGNMLSNRNFL